MSNFRLWTILLCLVLISNFATADFPHKNMAEALGYKADAKVLIINADDYGMCHAENLGTHQVLEYGIVSSTTMMVVCPWTLEAIDYVHKNNMRNVGVHVALTSEWKRYRWRPLSFGHKANSLVDESGYMWHEAYEVELFANTEDIKKEVRAQLQFALDQGVDLSHFDSHMGSLYGIFTGRIELLALALAISYEFGLPYRVPYIPVLLDPFRDKGHAILDRLDLVDFQPKDPAERREYFLNFIRNLTPGVTEIYIHPAVANDELKRITNSHKMRQGDVDIFLDPEIRQALVDNKVHVISFEKMRQYQRENSGWHAGARAEDVYEEYRAILQKQARHCGNWQEILKQAAFCPE